MFCGHVVRIQYSCSTLMGMDNGWQRSSSGLDGTRISPLRNNGSDPLRKCDTGAEPTPVYINEEAISNESTPSSYLECCSKI